MSKRWNFNWSQRRNVALHKIFPLHQKSMHSKKIVALPWHGPRAQQVLLGSPTFDERLMRPTCSTKRIAH